MRAAARGGRKNKEDIEGKINIKLEYREEKKINLRNNIMVNKENNK